MSGGLIAVNFNVNLWLLDLDTLEKRLVVKDFGVDKKGAIYLKN